MDEETTPAETGPMAQEPRWLTSEEQDAWRSLAAIALRLPGALDARMQRDAGLTLFEYLVLAELSEAPDRSRRMSNLAALTNGSLSRLSHVVKRLEQRGWVRREACPEDKRATHAILTESGWAKTVASAPQHVEAARHLVIDALTTTQLRHLPGMARRILERIDPDEPCLPKPTRKAK
ncbi:MarR family transcriptional regulator [Streptomyces sp. NPDC005480]|uniref:MarR family winged helix-turn-helix transcriptional regulator n=1 Tax=Streptomyces sp. NPDC005480 TaxID=3154880 RepID=UPI0033A57AEE